jgi:hypothetical protein
MHKFSEAYRREGGFLIAGLADDLLHQLLRRIAATLGGNHHAGIQDQSHAGGFSCSRFQDRELLPECKVFQQQVVARTKELESQNKQEP